MKRKKFLKILIVSCLAALIQGCLLAPASLVVDKPFVATQTEFSCPDGKSLQAFNTACVDEHLGSPSPSDVQESDILIPKGNYVLQEDLVNKERVHMTIIVDEKPITIVIHLDNPKVGDLSRESTSPRSRIKEFNFTQEEIDQPFALSGRLYKSGEFYSVRASIEVNNEEVARVEERQ